MNKLRLLGAVYAAMFLLSVASASPLLDQSNVYDPGFTGSAVVTGHSLAQTFTVGLSGALTRVDLQLYKSTGSTVDLTFDIRDVIGGVPDPGNANALFTTSISLELLPTRDLVDNVWVPDIPVPLTSIELAGAGIFVHTGDQLALTLRRMAPGRPPWVIWSAGRDTYNGGLEYFRQTQGSPWRARPNNDLGFQTHIPEPTTLALVSLGLAGIGIARWRRGSGVQRIGHRPRRGMVARVGQKEVIQKA